MREIETFEEARPSALAGRAWQLLAGAALVVACAVFAAGVVVGKKRSGPSTSEGDDPLARLDQALAAEEPESAVDRHTPLTFHRTLVEPETPTVSPSELLAMGAASAAQREGGSGQAATTAPAPAPAPAIVHVQRGGEVEVQPAAPPADRAAPRVPEGADGPYTLQVASYQDEQEARRTSARLRGEGFRTFITAADIPDRGTWFRVRIGPFHSQGEVDRQKREYEERMRAPAIVVKREDSSAPSPRRRR